MAGNISVDGKIVGAISIAAVSNSATIGTTLSSLVGFYGTAGTSQPAAAAQGAVTCTAYNPTTCTGVIGFSTTAAMSDVLALVQQIRTTLVNVGLMKGSS